MSRPNDDLQGGSDYRDGANRALIDRQIHGRFVIFIHFGEYFCQFSTNVAPFSDMESVAMRIASR